MLQAVSTVLNHQVHLSLLVCHQVELEVLLLSLTTKPPVLMVLQELEHIKVAVNSATQASKLPMPENQVTSHSPTTPPKLPPMLQVEATLAITQYQDLTMTTVPQDLTQLQLDLHTEQVVLAINTELPTSLHLQVVQREPIQTKSLVH